MSNPDFGSDRGGPATEYHDLGGRVLRGAFWLATLRGVSQGVGFLQMLFLARLLTPLDFGLVALVVLTAMWVEAFTQPSFDLALVQSQDESDEYLDTAWTLQVLRSVLVAVIVGVVAVPVSMFFDQPLLAPMLGLMAGTILVAGLINVAVVRFKKNLEFRKQFVYEVSGILADVLISVTLAFVLRNAWALLLGGLARQVGLLCASYLLSSYRPRLRVQSERLRRLFRFGRWMLVENTAEVLMTQVDTVLVGRLFGPAAVGLYQMSYRIANVPRFEISGIAIQVAFPAYSKLKGDVAQARAAFLDALRLLSVVALPSAIGIGLVAPEFVRIVLGAAWLDAIPVLQVLAIYGALSAVEFKKPLVLAFGRPDLDAKVDMLRLATLLVLMVPLALAWGLIGVSIAVVASMGVGLAASLVVCARLLDFGLLRYLGIFAAPAAGGAALLAAGWLVRSLAAGQSDLVVFTLTVVTGVVTFGVAVFVVDSFTDRSHRAVGARVWRTCFKTATPVAAPA